MDIDEVECPNELVQKRLRDIFLKECDLGLVFLGNLAVEISQAKT